MIRLAQFLYLALTALFVYGMNLASGGQLFPMVLDLIRTLISG